MTAELMGMRREEGPMAFVLYTRVCSDGTPEEVEAWVRREHPAGTTGNWSLCTEDHQKPVPCVDKPGFKHFMFVC